MVAGQLLDTHRPRTLVLNAGAAPLPRPVHRQTWQTFSRNWDVDVQHVFNWTREALLLPLEPGSAVIAFSSGAAVNGSPLSGGYAGAKATIRFIASYAAAESGRNALGIKFTSVLPQLSPETDLGAAGSRRLRRQTWRRYPRLPRPPRPGAHPRAGGHRDRRHCHRPRQ